MGRFINNMNDGVSGNVHDIHCDNVIKVEVFSSKSAFELTWLIAVFCTSITVYSYCF